MISPKYSGINALNSLDSLSELQNMVLSVCFLKVFGIFAIKLFWGNNKKMSDRNMTNTIDLLKQATAGLMMNSESEYPFTVFTWELMSLNETTILEKTGLKGTVNIVKIDDFFRNSVTPQDWHENDEKATIKRFQNLVNMLKTNLTDLQVYKIGSKEIDVYILGTTNNNIIGLATKVIET